MAITQLWEKTRINQLNYHELNTSEIILLLQIISTALGGLEIGYCRYLEPFKLLSFLVYITDSLNDLYI